MKKTIKKLTFKKVLLHLLHLHFVLIFVYSYAIFNTVYAGEKEMIEEIIKLSKPLPSDKIFYTWTNKKSAQRRISEGVFTDQEYQKMLERAKNDPQRGIHNRALAGSGIYIAEDPYSSSIYGSEIYTDEGALLEVKVDKGTPYIDLTMGNVVKELNEKGIKVEDVYKLNPAILVKYCLENDWWVVKTNQGIHFREVTGHNLTEDDLSNLPREFKYQTPKAIFRNALSKISQQIKEETFERSIERNAWKICKKRNGVRSLLHSIDINLTYPGKSENYGSKNKEEGEGTSEYVINYPQYDFQGKNYYLSAESDFNGICKHFGYKMAKDGEESVKTGLSYGGMLKSIFGDYSSVVVDKRGFTISMIENTSIVLSIVCIGY
ncbi:MAG: hypothetical protein HQK49_17885 [Oligoflexia bacterium]|nr:hypothetical protein [Oligoflexia bacterium]